jgi:large subunit ribosomal protein L19
MNYLIKYVEATCNPQPAQAFPPFKAGDTINVHVKIQEGNKVRIQQFQGTVIQRKNTNTNGETFTVRKVTKEIGVERIFPLNSPNIEKIEVKSRGRVRRARIYYLRGKQGKAARIKELR